MNSRILYLMTVIAIALTTLTITGNVTNLFVKGGLTYLDASKNTGLIHLNCSYSKLTNMDVSKNTALTYLDCSYNELSAEALNALFGTLHSNTISDEKRIVIGGNPGTGACNNSIATNKW